MSIFKYKEGCLGKYLSLLTLTWLDLYSLFLKARRFSILPVAEDCDYNSLNRTKLSCMALGLQGYEKLVQCG